MAGQGGHRGGWPPNWERVTALHEALKEGLAARMRAGRWSIDAAEDTGLDDGVVGAFRYPIADEFAATAWFAWLGDFPPLKIVSSVGVSYERSHRLWPLLVGRNPSECRVGVEDVLGVPEYEVELWEIGEVDDAVGRLVAPVLEHLVSWAEPFASVDALLEVLRGSDEDTTDRKSTRLNSSH